MSLKVGYESVPTEAEHYFEQHRWEWQDRFLRGSTALYDPIFTPLFTSLFTTLGFSATTAALLGAGAAAIATTALAIGIQALLAPKPPKPEDGKVPKVQSVPYRWWGVGRNRVAGAYMLWEAVGKKLFAVQAIAGHRIKSINRYWLHDDEVTLQGDGTINSGTNYRTNVQILSRLGLVPETDYPPITSALSSQGVWSSNHRGDGQASVAMICTSSNAERQQKTFPYGPPQLSVEADMALCWDFRDPLQDPENPATWQWTRNAALIMAWHQCFNEFGHKRDYTRAILPVLDMWQEEADVCDELVPLAGGGNERRYECNGFDTTENDPKAATNAILASCDGWICERGDGALLFIVGKFRAKYLTTLTDADIVGHQIEYDVLFEDECNRLVPKFCYPEIGYATSDTDYFEDVGAQLIAGRVLAQEANYQWVQQWRQARRLGKRDWLRLQQKVTGQLNVRLSGINSVYSRWVRLVTPNMLPRLDGKIVENRKSVLSLLQGGFVMDIMQHPENIDVWNPATDEGRQPSTPPRTTPTGILTPVINLVQARPNGDSVYVRVVIIDPEDNSLIPVVRYRLVDAGSRVPGAWVEQRFPNPVPAGGFIDMSTNVVPSNKALDVQVAFIASDGDYGPWSITANVTSTVDPTAPATPVNMTTSNASGTVTVSATAANDNTRYLVFKRGTTGQSFAAATLIGQYNVTANQTISFPNTPGAGTWKYWCGAENGSGIPSPSQASSTITI
ncbi:putative tail fiber protein [Rhizobium phage RHph_N28_2]|nr:putative tail fiber protein [Rhizobium phage RHph_N28_2]